MKKWDIDFPAPLSQRPVLDPHHECLCPVTVMWLFTRAPETGDVSWFRLFHWKLLQRIVNVEHHMRLAVIFNGNPRTHWICFYHLNKWNADRARFLADGGGCEMEEVGNPCEKAA